jgi:two-component sensor histidine kinase
MEAILSEKEFIMREVHHRIRNNLQMISSFLSLEATLFPTKNIHEIIHSCQSRILSLSLLHDNLHQSAYSDYMDIKNYLENLVTNLTQNNSNKSLKIQYEFENSLFKTEQLIPLGLLVNEIISIENNKTNNSQIQITGKIVSTNYELIYKTSNLVNQNNLGKDSLTMKLINGFARQLNSKISVEISNEIVIKNSFPIPEFKKNDYI